MQIRLTRFITPRDDGTQDKIGLLLFSTSTLHIDREMQKKNTALMKDNRLNLSSIEKSDTRLFLGNKCKRIKIQATRMG